jgi:hypothetical protein
MVTFKLLPLGICASMPAPSPTFKIILEFFVLRGASALFVCLKLQIRDSDVVIKRAHGLIFRVYTNFVNCLQKQRCSDIGTNRKQAIAMKTVPFLGIQTKIIIIIIIIILIIMNVNTKVVCQRPGNKVMAQCFETGRKH